MHITLNLYRYELQMVPSFKNPDIIFMLHEYVAIKTHCYGFLLHISRSSVERRGEMS